MEEKKIVGNLAHEIGSKQKNQVCSGKRILQNERKSEYFTALLEDLDQTLSSC